ncbi:hypothetical protein KJ656_03130 [bacterium]|nr:hypothetical protein [bacterium]
MRRYNQLRIKSILIVFLLGLLFLFNMACIGPKPKVITVQVISKDEGGKPLQGAQVTIMKGKETRQVTTQENGRMTIETKYATPFQIKVSNPSDDSFLDTELEITDKDFPGERQQIFKEIYIEKKKTTITGQIIDWETKKPVPVVSVRVEPDVKAVVDSDTSGVFNLKSPDFQEGVIYTVYFTRSRHYNDRRYHDIQKNIEDITLYETIDMGTIEMESTEVEKGVIIEGEMEIREGRGEMPSVE